jgi:glutathione peroxidase-family protein
MAMSLVEGPMSFYALRFLLGVAEAALYPGILYFVTKWFPMRHRYGVDPANRADVLWNFQKFLIGRNGEVVGHFSPDVMADDPRLVAAIDADLAKA